MAIRKHPKEHVYFNSQEAIESILNNSNERKFEIIESEIGFAHAEFRNRIKDELVFIGLEIFELAKSTYISNERMSSYLRGKNNLTTNEISRIKTRLGM